MEIKADILKEFEAWHTDQQTWEILRWWEEALDRYEQAINQKQKEEIVEMIDSMTMGINPELLGSDSSDVASYNQALDDIIEKLV